MNWFYLWLSFFSLFCLGLGDNARGPVFPDLLREYSLKDTQGALFFVASSSFGLLNNLSSGYWLPRLGPFRSLQVFLGLMGFGLVGIGLSPTFTWVFVSSAIFGVGMGGLGIAQNILVGRGSTPAFRRQAYSALHCMYGAAALLAPLVVSAVYYLGFSWHVIFLGLSIPCWILLAASFVGGWRTAGNSAFIDGAADAPSNLGSRKARAPVAWRLTLWMATITTTYVVSEIVISSRLVLLARRDFGLDAIVANRYLFLFSTCLFLGRLTFAFLRAPLRPHAMMQVSALASFVLSCIGLIWDPLWLALAGLTLAPFFPCAMAFIQEELGDSGDLAVSWSLTLNSLGLMLMHFFVGVLSDGWGLRFAMWIGPACLILTHFLLGRYRQTSSSLTVS